MASRVLKWLLIVLAVLVALVAILAALPNWNWLRGPIERVVGDKTGRELQIGSDLKVRLGWPAIGIAVGDVRFSNPEWAQADTMVAVEAAAVDVAILPLFGGDVVFNEVRLDQADVDLEQSADGRRNWLLDQEQRDEEARVVIKRLAVNAGRIRYRDAAGPTDIRAQVATRETADDSAAPFVFSAHGTYLGQALAAAGTGDSVLALRNETRPYGLAVSGRIGPTAVQASGHITNLLQPTALDLQIAVRGGSLAQLYPLVGVVFPDTPAYQTKGRLIHAASMWRYEKFSGTIGSSDIAGMMQIDTRGKRPFLVAKLDSRRLRLADLGPVIGTGRPDGDTTAPAGRVLPSEPFDTARWDRMDADVTFNAGSIVRPEALPIYKLATRLYLHEGNLRLDPLRFDVAGGTLAGRIQLDGRQSPIRAAAKLEARKLQLARLFPKLDLDKTSIGEIHGDIDLKGRGDSVAAMLGSADGKVAMVVGDGAISRLMMETVGLHLLQMLRLKLTGDEPIRINCAIAALDVKDGMAQVDTLVFDSDVVRIDGSGRINLEQETLDVTVVPDSKQLRLVAVNTPLHVGGRFAEPDIDLDAGELALRGLGALALGAVNPALALLPLIEIGPGPDSNCARLIREAGQAAKASSR